MKISKASIGDVVDLLPLINSAYRGETSRLGWTTEADLLDGIRIDQKSLKDMLSNSDSTLLKVENNKTIIGCVYLKKEDNKLYLGMLTVMPTLQNNGIGKMLLLEAENQALVFGCSIIYMRVITDRIELIEWYLRQGFHATGNTEPFILDPKFGKTKKDLAFTILQKSI